MTYRECAIAAMMINGASKEEALKATIVADSIKSGFDANAEIPEGEDSGVLVVAMLEFFKFNHANN